MSWSLKVTGAAALATVLASLSLFPAYDGQQWLWASLVTIAFVGYDGGRIADERLADHVVVTHSEHVPRIQEAQATAYHVLRELVEEADA